MGLPVRERQTLGRIESGLRGSDPGLVSMYTIFARLNAGEELPRIEQLRHRLVVLVVAARFRLGRILGFLGRPFRRLIPRRRVLLFFPLALALLAVSIVFAARSSSGRGCPAIPPSTTTSAMR